MIETRASGLQHCRIGFALSTVAASTRGTGTDRPDGGFVALVLVGHTSHHSLVKFKDVSEGDSCWERGLLISLEKMKERSATKLSQPLLFDAAHIQAPSLGQQCIFSL